MKNKKQRPKQGANCAKTSIGCVPLTDMKDLYLGKFSGGLYPVGNTIPEPHYNAGFWASSKVQPINGKYVLLSIGMSSTSFEFCRKPGGTLNPTPESFMSQARANANPNLVIVNGAYSSRTSEYWDSDGDTEYTRVNTLLKSVSLSESQVQAVWLKVVSKSRPQVSLPDEGADAYATVTVLGKIVRALKKRYPNLQQVFISSRVYAGYSRLSNPLFPEPYSYEHGFAVKWFIEAQINQAATGAIDPRAGDLSYSSAPWIGWGPYLWADGLKPRGDGLMWLCADFARGDGTHPSATGVKKVGGLLVDFFQTSPLTPWFRQ